MTSNEAGKRISNAIATLMEVRDELGAGLALAPDPNDADMCRKAQLHDRAARAISAYRNG